VEEDFTMIDTGLIVEVLRSHGHAVGHVNKLPANAGEWEFEVDGGLLTLEETRALIESDDARASTLAREHRAPSDLQS
jgi:hypothetical protein